MTRKGQYPTTNESIPHTKQFVFEIEKYRVEKGENTDKCLDMRHVALKKKGGGLIPYPNTCLQYKSFENLCKKEKLLLTSNFSFSHSVFYPFEKLSSIFTKFEIIVSKLFQSGRVENLSFGKGLMHLRKVLT